MGGKWACCQEIRTQPSSSPRRLFQHTLLPVQVRHWCSISFFACFMWLNNVPTPSCTDHCRPSSTFSAFLWKREGNRWTLPSVSKKVYAVIMLNGRSLRLINKDFYCCAGVCYLVYTLLTPRERKLMNPMLSSMLCQVVPKTNLHFHSLGQTEQMGCF